MSSILEQQIESVVSDPRSSKYNEAESDRTFVEILSDPAANEFEKQDVVESFRKTFIKAPPIRGQEVRAVGPDTPGIKYFPPEAPTGGLQPGETVNLDGSLNFDPALEATQSYDIDVNLGSLAEGKMTRDGVFLAGPARPGSPTIKFTLPPGIHPDAIPEPVYKWMVEYVQKEFSEEYQEATQRDSVLKTAAVAATREASLGLPSIVDFPSLIARGADYVFSPTGTNTLAQDIGQGVRKAFGLRDDRPRPDSVFLDDYPRLLESLGMYTTEYPSALFGPAVTIQPDRELSPAHHASGVLLDEILKNLDMPGALTPQQITDAQQNATFIGSVMGGSLTVGGLFRVGAKLAVKGMTVADLKQAGVLNKALYSLANSPGVTLLGGKAGRRFVVPGPDGRDMWRGSATAKYLAKDQVLSVVAGGAMLATAQNEDAGPLGMLMAGLTAPVVLYGTALRGRP